MMTLSIDAKACAQLFTEARTHNAWQDKPVSDEILQQLYDLLKWAPTSANAAPARFIFVKSPEAKAKLKPSLSEGNVEKTMSAPVTVTVPQASKPLRVVRVAEDGHASPSSAGRMVMSGRMADICAELDRLVHLEASKSLR